jgi:hypothetical protein
MSEHGGGLDPETLRPDAPAGPMQTLLRRFAEQFERRVGPLVQPVQAAAESLAAADDRLPARSVLPQLRDLAHQLQSLQEKIAGQQAYVLIFGPLKSGKSTFMNAMCSAYVSEVTSLPAYPCIVSVSHADQTRFTVVRYDGSRETFEEAERLHRLVDAAHASLTDRIRHVEAGGEEFDPATHMPEAIRRVEVRRPSGDLAESGAVLVDTPGLYARMKFGYDQMTRDFRDAAACAVFVVKTDNLFLEQVFAEFQELLGLFSRIFLIVNLDSTKQDLLPDGRLAPSLEHEDPGRIIEAFRDLSMSAPLKTAADAGRLSIYPVDLLRAASRRIRGGDEAGAAEEGFTPPAGQSSFDDLLGDLTDYLNSNEYLWAFLSDSLQRAATLTDELGQLRRGEAVAGLAAEADRLSEARDEASARIEAIERLGEVDWSGRAGSLREGLREAGAGRAGEIREEVGDAIESAIEDWFETDASLARLNREQLVPLLGRGRDRLRQYIRSELDRRRCDLQADLDEPVRRDLAAVGIDLEPISRSAMDTAGAEAAGAEPGGIRPVDVPVKRRFWDFVLFRSPGKVRRRLLGPPEEPDKAVPPAEKGKRIGEAGRASMNLSAQNLLDEAIGGLADKLTDRGVAGFIELLSKSIDEQLEARRADAARRIEQLDGQIAEVRAVLERFEALDASLAEAETGLAELRREYVRPAGDAGRGGAGGAPNPGPGQEPEAGGELTAGEAGSYAIIDEGEGPRAESPRQAIVGEDDSPLTPAEGHGSEQDQREQG